MKRLNFVGLYDKQPAAVVPTGHWGVDFSNDLADTENVIVATVTVVDDAGADVTAAMTFGGVLVDPTGKKVSTGFRAGADDETYKCTISATSDAGGVYEADFQIVVLEI